MNRAHLIQASRRLGAVCLVGLALAGCGRRGNLEAPPGSTPPQQQTVIDKEKGTSRMDAVVPATRSNVVPPRTPFVLDPIL